MGTTIDDAFGSENIQNKREREGGERMESERKETRVVVMVKRKEGRNA